uniref:Uncharacterized protein n=1 Tax=viral metagenome TaxID=1070528 RepID=A0A6C0F0L2_9ZZZZ
MFNLIMFLFMVLLFFVLTPGILFTLPPKSNKTVVALVNGVIFALIWNFSHKMLWNLTEGFNPNIPDTNSQSSSSDVNTSSNVNLLTMPNKSEISDRSDSGNMKNQLYTPETSNMNVSNISAGQSFNYSSDTKNPLMTNPSPMIKPNKFAISDPQKNMIIDNPPKTNKITDYIKYFNKNDSINGNIIADDYMNIINSKEKIINFIKSIIDSKQITNSKIIIAYRNFMSVLNKNI